MLLAEPLLLNILLAAFVGALIGLEREYHDKTAGLRTMILVATGSALFTIMSTHIGGTIDPARVAAAVVSGIGFLGAGAVIKNGLNIRGLTTAASIWLVASLGMGMGAGAFALTGGVTVFILIVLWMLPPLERKIDAMHEFLEFTIVIKNTDKQEEKLFELFDAEEIRYVSVNRSKLKSTERELRIMMKNNPDKHHELQRKLASNKAVVRFNT